MKSYLAITPAKDEEKFLPGLIRSMAAQTRLPKRWLVIDDGSTDGTGALLDDAARQYPWLATFHVRSGAARAEGGEGILARFLTPDFWRQADAVFRVDADITFGPDYVELLLEELEREPRLGIASGTIYEFHRGAWREIAAPRFHTRGALKLYTHAYLDIAGPPPAGLGWDTIDEAKAAATGFITRNFRHVHAFHHRPQGSAQGALRGRQAAGRAAYQAGYSPLFMIMRAGRHLLDWPPIIGAAVMMAGFAEGYLRGQPPAAPPELIAFIRREQKRRLLMMKSLWS